ncbi:MAG: hypothetical protein ACHRHE_09625 [Tepidisphaerales bacterium]
MTAESQLTEKMTSPPGESGDLSQAIQQFVNRLPGEEVRCKRLWGNRYRCNWWAYVDGDGVANVGRRIARSKFLKVTQTPDGLLIEDLTR